jgi:asparagine synthase (glutamine-hydrolysing)
MCGILAVIDTNHAPIARETIWKSTKSMSHRGPDGQNIWTNESGTVGLGHARLSIIDLSGGTQPLHNEQADCVAVVNGEFYDYEKTRRQLQKEGFTFQTQSDSEILIHLWEKYGTECIHHLRGEFAFVLWDSRKEVLFVARDRFGIKPLYYTNKNGRWIFASEVKAIKAFGNPIEFNDLSVELAFTYGLNDTQTLFQGISQLAPGHLLWISGKSLNSRKYWDFNYPEQGDTSQMSFEEAKEEVQRLLLESVALRLRADVSVGMYLSGGLDSSAVAGMAVSLGGKTKKAYTIAFDDERYDEKSLASETAQHLGIPITVLNVNESDIADHFFQAIAKCEGMIEDPAPIAKFLLSRLVSNHGDKVVLTGEGSDEIFGGYPHFRQDMFLHNQQGQLKGDIEDFEQALLASNSLMSGGLLGDFNSPVLPEFETSLGFTPMIYKTIGTSIPSVFPLFQENKTQPSKRNQLAKLFLHSFDIQNQLKNRDPMHASMYFWSKTFLCNRLLRSYGDGMEMSHSIEGRVPFLDHHLVDFVSKLPVHYKAKGLTDKFILREAAKPYLTSTIFARQKHPFSAPPVTHVKNGKLMQLLMDTLHSDRVAQISILNRDRCKRIASLLATTSGPHTKSLEVIALRIASLVAIHQSLVSKDG